MQLIEPRKRNDYLLEIPACILAEDDKYLVIAIRIERSTISENMHFLAALFDHAAPIDYPEGRRPCR